MAFPGPCIVPWFLPQNMPQCITLCIEKARYCGSLSDDGCPLPRHKVASFQTLSLCEIIAILFKNFNASDLTFILNIQHAILKARKPRKYRMKQLL
jgi:hypothetical protein